MPLQKGETANPAPAASGANYAFAKGFRRRQATTNWPPHKNCPLQKLPPNRVPLFGQKAQIATGKFGKMLESGWTIV